MSTALTLLLTWAVASATGDPTVGGAPDGPARPPPVDVVQAPSSPLRSAQVATEPTAWLLPDTVLTPPEGLRLVLKRSPSPGITTIRAFIPLDETFEEAGIGRVLAGLAAERVRGTVARIGATFEASRTPTGIAYAVTGSDEDFDYLAFILRRALAEPGEQAVVVRRIAGRAQRTLERESETGRGWISADLSAKLCPTLAPEAGVASTLSTLTPAGVQRFWRRTHRRERASLIVVSRASRPLVFSALRSLGLPPTDASEGAPPSTSAPPARPQLQVLRRWYGEAHPLPLDARAETLVLARSIDGALGPSPQDYDLFVEFKSTRCADALLVLGTAYRAGDRQMRARVGNLLDELAGSLREGTVRNTASAVGADLLRAAALPASLADALGREGADRGDPGGLARLHARLAEIELEDLATYLEGLARLEPLRSEVRP